jgi:hypothetical protein
MWNGGMSVMKNWLVIKAWFKRNVSNIMLIISIIFAMLILFSPIILKLDCLRNIIILFLSRMNGIKSSYFEVIGALSGTFLAITAAAWTQRIINGETEKQRGKDNALIVYYDLYLGLNDLKKLYISLSNNKFINYKPNSMYFSSEWIKNVATIREALDLRSKKISNANKKVDLINDIYTLYGNLLYICELLNRNTPLINLKLAVNDISESVFTDKFETEFINRKIITPKDIDDVENKIKSQLDIIDLNENYKLIITELDLIVKF